jgi:hypothetical protein
MKTFTYTSCLPSDVGADASGDLVAERSHPRR